MLYVGGGMTGLSCAQCRAREPKKNSSRSARERCGKFLFCIARLAVGRGEEELIALSSFVAIGAAFFPGRCTCVSASARQSRAQCKRKKTDSPSFKILRPSAAWRKAKEFVNPYVQTF